MYKYLGSLLAALVVTGVVASAEPAQAQISIRIGPPPSPYHFWVPERRHWTGRRYVHTPGRWERRAYRRAERQHWRQERRRERWEERRERRDDRRQWREQRYRDGR
jgi:hypothetical protein